MYKTKSFLLISLLKFGLFKILSKITNYTMKKNQSQSQCWYANIRANKRIYFITFILQWNVIQWYYWNFIEILKLIYNRLISKQECFIRYNLLLSIYLTNKSKYPKKVHGYIINHWKIILLFMQEANRQQEEAEQI